MAQSKTKFVKVLISLPETCVRFLEDLKRLEGVTVSGYLRAQIEGDLQARVESGWDSYHGWDTPEAKREIAHIEKRAQKGYIKMIRGYLKREDAKQAARTGRKKGR